MANVETTGSKIWTETGGEGSPTLLLIHGLGANGTVWEGLKPLVKKHWPGAWVNLDLRGHGRSGHSRPYGFGTYAADIASALGGQDERVTIVGHSMGGVVAMALATGWFGLTVERVLAFGVKIAWTKDEVAKAKQIAAAPVRWFDTREEAIERHLKVSGLIGLVEPDSPEAAVGIREEGGRFRLAADPWINAVAGPEVAPVYRAAQAPIRLAAGDGDKMVSVADMTPLDSQAVTLPGVGHNAHVERPDLIWKLLEETA
ncbi:MAG: alpha/beta fold hydrolase [Alphaproteobacteria bacterium]